MQWNRGGSGNAHINFYIQLTGSICQNSDFEIIGHLGDCNGIEDSMDHDINPTDGMITIDTFEKMKSISCCL